MPAFPKYTHGSVNILELFAEVFDLSTDIGDGTGHKTSLELILVEEVDEEGNQDRRYNNRSGHLDRRFIDIGSPCRAIAAGVAKAFPAVVPTPAPTALVTRIFLGIRSR